MCRLRQSDDAVSACNQHGCRARSPDGCGFIIPLQWSLDIINVFGHIMILIPTQVTRAGESLRSDILKDLRRLSQSSSGCFCVCVKVHFDTDESHRLVSVTGPNLVCHLNNLKIFFGPLFFYLVTLWHSKSNTIKFLFSCLAGVCILSSKRLLLDMSFTELWLYENSICMRAQERERESFCNK